MKLVNTIEISPLDFADAEYEFPNGSSKELPSQWNKFWKKCVGDKNLDSLEAIKKGSYFVDITTIGNNELKVIIENELEEVDLDDYEEQVGRLCGGIVIKLGDKFPIEPTCCGDLGNIHEWKDIFQQKTNTWNQLWIGHPWIFYKVVSNKVQFSDYYEENLKSIENLKPILEISLSELESQLEIVEQQQIDFEARVKKTLNKLDIQNSKEIAKIMTGNE